LFTLYLVVPCYNEEAVLPETARRLDEIMTELTRQGRITEQSRILFVNDGSKDRTWELISRLHSVSSRYAGLCLSRNRGHQNALLAGLMLAKDHADAAISLDADLQDDVEAIYRFCDKYEAGCDIVYGVRSARDTDTAFKRGTARGFYKAMELLGVEIVYDHADYRLMSRRALEALSEYGERNLFLRGIAPQLGFRTDTVEYVRQERFAGESKYPLKKMIAFAVTGITSFSVRPLHFALILGGIALLVSVVILLYSLIRWLCGMTVSGWTSLMFSIWALGGLQLLMLGVVGEYVGKTYLEAKRRPLYLISETLLDEGNNGKS